MIERMKTRQAFLFFALSLPTLMQAQDPPDMTILFDYFDSTVTIYVDGDEIVIEGDGVPSHLSPYFVQTYGQTQNGFYYWLDSDGDGINDLWMQTPANMNLNPNRIAQQGYEFRIPLYPAINPNGPADTFLGPIGVSINGVPFFNEYESPTQTLTNQVIQSFDPGNGHPAPQGNYHYHFPPESLITVTEDNFLGFAGDGFPVYGPKNPDGNNAQNLDDYHGEFGPTPDFPDSIYHYHTNFTSPYIIGAFAGTLGTGFGGGGGGGGGGDPPDCGEVPPGAPCCGDGNCGGPETETNCPEDCATTIDYTIMVNEFLASSETCCGTELFGSGEDFVELYNHGSEPVNIYGWGFSDTDGTVATTAPDTVIQPGKFLVLWFTGDANGFPEIDSKLSSDGETIYAADSSGTAVFSLDFGVQDEDVSYGRYPDGSDSWQQMNPTPGVTNTNELGLDDDVTIPEQYTLHQNYPNPFNPRTSIRYDLPDNERVNIIIYDMLGRQVKQLVDEYQDAGFKSIIWDATNDFGKPAATGVYLCKIQAGEYMQTKKMVLLK
mgnify:FL=1